LLQHIQGEKCEARFVLESGGGFPGAAGNTAGIFCETAIANRKQSGIDKLGR
jgi:hypothetical protein